MSRYSHFRRYMYLKGTWDYCAGIESDTPHSGECKARRCSWLDIDCFAQEVDVYSYLSVQGIEGHELEESERSRLVNARRRHHR